MIYLNKELINNPATDYFPDGTIAFNKLRQFGLDVLEYTSCDIHMITWNFDHMGELFEIIALNDWIRSNSRKPVVLSMPYIPNARMDRIKSRADVFTLKSFCKIINRCKFDSVYVQSAHSSVALALLNNVINEEPGVAWLNSQLSHYDTVFLPDEGAVKRFGDRIKNLDLNVVTAIKDRDWKTGQIKKLTVIGDESFIKDKRIIILDDLCSKGGSFKFAAIELKNLGAEKIDLFITHCENVIDTKSLAEAGISAIYTTNSIWRKTDPLVTVI